MFNYLLNFKFWNNACKDYLMAAIIFFALLAIFKIIQTMVLRRLEKIAKKTKTNIDDVLIEIAKGIKPPIYFLLAIYFSVKFLNFTPLVNKIADGFLIFIIVYQAVTSIQIFIDFLAVKISKKEGGGIHSTNREALKNLSLIFKIFIWILAVLLILSNWGVNITSVVAGLGIGGVAIAFALQNILEDIFSSFSIFIDKPFEIGDFIIVGEDMGTVEKIGIKTTRVRTLQGEELVVSNKELTAVRVHNYKKMEKRRVVFSLGVCYETPTEKLKTIPQTIQEIIKKVELTAFDRAHFKDYSDFSLNFEIVYYINSSDYNQYMNIQQEINFEIKDKFEKMGIEFAYPTQSVFLKKE
ncbi:MAG: mechanosensitive ion channel family protein [bacterium]